MNYFSAPQGDNKPKTEAIARNITTRDMSQGNNDQSWTTTNAWAKSNDFYDQQHQLHNLQSSNSVWWSHLTQNPHMSQSQHQVYTNANPNLSNTSNQSNLSPGFLYSSERWRQQLQDNQSFSAPPPLYSPHLSQSHHQLGLLGKNTSEQEELQHKIKPSIPQPPPPPPLPSTLPPLPPPPPLPPMKQEIQKNPDLWASAVSMKEQKLQANIKRTLPQTENVVKKENSYVNNNLELKRESHLDYEDSDDVESTIESVQMDISIDSDSYVTQDSFDQRDSFKKEEAPPEYIVSEDSLDDPTSRSIISGIVIDNIPYVHQNNEQNRTRKNYLETESKTKENKSQSSPSWTSSKPSSPSSVHQYINDWSGSSPSSKQVLPDKNNDHIESPRKFKSDENDEYSEEDKSLKQEIQRNEVSVKEHKPVKKTEHLDEVSDELAQKRARVLQSIKLASLKRRKVAEIQKSISPLKVKNFQHNRKTNEEINSSMNQDVASKVDDKASLPDITALSQRIFIKKISQSGPVNKVRIQDENSIKEKLFNHHKNTSTAIDEDKRESKVESKNILLDIEENQRQNDEHRMKLARLKELLAAKVREQRNNKRKTSPVVAAKVQVKSPESPSGGRKKIIAEYVERKERIRDTKISHMSPKPSESIQKEENKSDRRPTSSLILPSSKQEDSLRSEIIQKEENKSDKSLISSRILSPSKLGGNEVKKAHTLVQSSIMHVKLMKQKRELQNSIDLNKMRNIQKQQLELLKVQRSRLQEKASLLDACTKEIEVEKKIILMKEKSSIAHRKRKLIMEKMLVKMNVKLMNARKQLRDYKEKQSTKPDTLEMSHARSNTARRGRASDFF